MKITVITVCLNSEKTIEKTVRSVIAQRGWKWELEYIVVDGGSSDGTMSVIKKYSDHIDKYVSEPDRGIFDAMNKGIRMASGDIIAFLNSDDWYEENALKIVACAFMNEDCDCVCCDNYVLGRNGQRTYYDASKYVPDDLRIQMIYYHSAIFCKKEFLKKVGNFDLRYKIAADYNWFLGIVKRGARVRYLHQPVFTFSYGGVSSIHEIECAREARQIALCHLPADERIYRERIDSKFCESVLFASDKGILSHGLAELLGRQQVTILWGSGERGIRCAEWLQQSGIEVDAIVDSNRVLWGSFIGKVPVCSSEILDKQSCNLIITPKKYVDDIKKVLDSKKNDNIRVYELNELCGMLADYSDQDKEMCNENDLGDYTSI